MDPVLNAVSQGPVGSLEAKGKRMKMPFYGRLMSQVKSTATSIREGNFYVRKQ